MLDETVKGLGETGLENWSQGAWGRGFGYNSLKIFVSNLNASYRVTSTKKDLTKQVHGMTHSVYASQCPIPATSVIA